MWGTFKEGDYLQITRIQINELKRGDVVVFQGIEGKNIVHRIISIMEEKIYTRGDYNLFFDHRIVDSSMLIGKVTGYYRGNKFFNVANGYCGLLRARQIRIILLFKRKLLVLVNPIYSLIKITRIVPKLWKPNLKTIILDSKKGRKIKYTHNGKTVLVQDRDNIIFKRRPYDLLF